MNKEYSPAFSFSQYKSIALLKKAWKKMIDDDNGKIFLTYSYNKYACRLFRVQQLLRSIFKGKHIKQKVIFFVGKDNKKTVFIFPAVVDMKNKTILWLGASYSSGTGYNECIIHKDYSGLELWKEFIKYLEKEYKGYYVNLIDTANNDYMTDLLKQRPCVKITLNSCNVDTYNEWYNTLTKRSRQNLRTSYNRLNKDGKKYELFEYNSLSTKKKTELYKVYLKRSAQINGVENTESSIFHLLLLPFEMYFNIVFHLINKSSRASAVVLKIDNSISSIMILYREEGGVIVPKLAIDSDYSFYSPGVIMISEYIKELCSNNNNNEYFIDLSRGDERYKTVLGGIVYYNYVFNKQL